MGYVNKTVQVETTPTITAGAYSAGDVVGGRLDLTKLMGAGGGGTVRQVHLTDEESVGATFKLYLFDKQPTSIADNAAFASAMTVADLQALVGVVTVSNLTTLNAMDYYIEEGVDLTFAGALWGYLVCDATPTYSATDSLTLKVVAWQD